MRRRTSIQGSSVEACLQRPKPGQASHTAVDEANVVLQDGVSVVGVTEVHRNMRQGRLDQRMNARVGHECKRVGLGAKHQRIQAVKQGDALRSNLVTTVQEAAGVVLGGP